MERRNLGSRVETLEKTVSELETLPAQVEALTLRVGSLEGQFLQFRSETRGEFSALRDEMRAGFARVDGELVSVRDEMRAGFGEIRKAIEQGDEESRGFMRVLHEDLVARIAVLGEQFRRQ